MMPTLEEVAADLARRVELPLGLLVGDELDRGDQPDAAHLADQRMIGERAQLALQTFADLGRMLDQPALLDESSDFRAPPRSPPDGRWW